MAETPEWELQHLLDWLRELPSEEANDRGLAGLYLGLIEMDGTLTPAGAALLAVLEAEHCKRRITASGWMWANGSYADDPEPVGIAPHGTPNWESFASLAEAAGYAEEYPQGVQNE